MTPTCGEVDGRTRCLALSVASAVSGTIAGLPCRVCIHCRIRGAAGIQKTSEGRRKWSYYGLSSILHVLGHATTDMAHAFSSRPCRLRRSRTSALSALPGQRGQDHSAFLLSVSRSSPVPPPHVPPERSVPCRFAWPLPGGRAAVILFKAINEKSNDATQAKRTHVRSHRPRARSPSRARACPHVDLSRRSQFHARDSRDRRAGSSSSAATRHPAGAAAGGVRCHRTTPPPGPPAPRVPRSDRRARGWSRRTFGCAGWSAFRDLRTRSRAAPVTVLFRPYLLYLQYCKYTDVG
jgi:hypothetical protein